MGKYWKFYADQRPSFVVTFTLPYLLNADYANLQSKVGFIYGSVSVCLIACTWLFVPDCRGRSLEDVDRLFESNYPARKFHKIALDHNAMMDGNKTGVPLDCGKENIGASSDKRHV